MKFIFFAFLFLLHSSKPIHSNTSEKIDIEEPSDIFYDAVSDHFYVVSDEGTIKVMDHQMKTLKMLRFHGCDFEGVCVVDSFMYVSDESGKKILQFSLNTYNILNTYDIHNFGALNEGIEGLTYNKDTKTFIASYEKSPVAIMVFNKDFQQIKKVLIPGISDISSLTYYDGFLYVLSDEDASLSKLDPNNYTVLSTVRFNIINPEGVTFINKESFVVVSDAMQKMYTFNSGL